MKIMKAILYCLLSACATVARAEDTNLFGLDTTSVRLREAMQTTTNTGILPVFALGSQLRFERLLYQRTILFSHRNLREAEGDEVGEITADMSLGSMVYAARDFGESLPIWHKFGEAGEVIADSIGGVDEQLMNDDPAFQVAEQSWWRTMARNNDLRFGIRPINSSSYVYASGKWRWRGHDLFYTNLRVYYARSYYSNFEEPKVALTVGIPVVNGVSVTVGTSYTYHLKGDKNDDPVVRLRVQKVVWSGRVPSFIYGGIEMGQSSRIVGGFTARL